MLVLQAEVLRGCRDDPHREGLVFVHREVAPVQEEAHRGLQRVVAVKGLAQLQDAEAQGRQAHVDGHLSIGAQARAAAVPIAPRKHTHSMHYKGPSSHQVSSRIPCTNPWGRGMPVRLSAPQW